MTNPTLSELLSLVQIQGRVSEAHVDDFRRIYFADGNISVDEADSLFEINSFKDKPENWNELFIDSITAFLVYQTMPIGYINTANAAWLTTRINHDGVVETKTELELLLRVMKIAKNVTPELERFVLDQVKHAVAHGRGIISRGQQLRPGVIGEAEVETLRRVLYACSGEGGISITRNEAEALFDLNDACGDTGHHESWQKLFVGAIANHLMMVAAWNEPDLKEALRRQKWLEQPTGTLVVPSFSGLLKSGLSLFGKESAEFTHMNGTNLAAAERIEEKEANWLIERLNRDGRLDTNEKALLKFLEEESPDIHDSLLPLIKAA